MVAPLVVLALLACADVDGQGGVRSPLSPTVPWVRVLAVDLEPVVVAEGVARPAETAALVTALLERRLADLEGVVPGLAGVEPRPGLAHAVAPAARWRLSSRVQGEGDEVRLALQLCDEAEACREHEGEGSRLRPEALVADAAGWAGGVLDRRVLGDEARWSQPESADDYAVLIMGRAAGAVYGLRPPPALEELGDNRKDPLARAVYLDPQMPTAWYLRARSPLGGSLMARRLDADRAARLDPGDPVLVADAAALALAAGDAAGALRGFEALRGVAPLDLRFALPLAEAGLAAGAPEVTRRQVERLRSVEAARAERLSLEVRLAEATGGARPAEIEALLVEWQQVAPADPEPVQRRVELRVATQDLAGALALMPELRARAPGPGTLARELALASAVGGWAQAAALATELGQARLAASMEALALRAEPARAAEKLLGVSTDAERLARAHLLVEAGEADLALAEVFVVASADPWQPEALATCVEAWRALGRQEEARACAERLGRVDPLHLLALASPAPGPSAGAP